MPPNCVGSRDGKMISRIHSTKNASKVLLNNLVRDISLISSLFSGLGTFGIAVPYSFFHICGNSRLFKALLKIIVAGTLSSIGNS